MATAPKPDVEAALRACGCGELAPNMALMRIILAVGDERDIEPVLRAAAEAAHSPARQRLQDALTLWRQSPGAFAAVKAVLRSAEAGGSSVTDWKRAFDQAVALSPEAGVALYSLGRRDLLAAASGEIVQHLEARDLLRAGSRVLEIGCGIGRLMPAIARNAELVVGIDISPGMLRQAGINCLSANAMVVQVAGEDLAMFPADAFDLVLAIDSFPYVVAAGPAAAAMQIAEAARVLKPGGALVIANYSYRGDDDLDRHEIAALARQNGLEVALDGRREFALWDGLVFHLHKPG